METRRKRAAWAAGLGFALLLGHAATADASAECRKVPDSPGLMPAWFTEQCSPEETGTSVPSFMPDAARGPIVVQETFTNTVDATSVAGIATLTSFGALVPASGTDFPADLIRLPTDTKRVYQITGAGAVSRYSASGANAVLAPIPPVAGSTWTDTATDPTTGIVYASAVVGGCVSSTLSRLDVIAGTRVAVGPITGAGCIVSIAADNAGALWGVDVTADTLVSIDKGTGAGTVVGSLGFDTNFGQGMDCDPSTGTCYMFTISLTGGSSTDLRSVDTSTGATTLVGTIGSIAPSGLVQVAGAVFTTVSDPCAVDADCQDGDLCDGVETCVGTTCASGAPVACDDGLFCTIDSCTGADGVCAHASGACDDGDTCTLDFCDEAGDVCTHASPPPIVVCNPGEIVIDDATAGAPYPSTIDVSGLGPAASLCAVQLRGVSHTYPDDIDMLLVGPVEATKNAEIFSDVGGGFGIAGVDVSLKDAAAAALPNSGQIVSGTFKPTNIGAMADLFPAPAPAANAGSVLKIFSGNPNGSWSLYVRDQFPNDSGAISGGWCVSLVLGACSIDADCGDGNACTEDTCVNGICVAGTPRACDDANACTADTCDGATGQCVYAGIACDDGNSCTDDSCDPPAGCVYTPDDLNTCSDGSSCTSPDVCRKGACAGQNPVACPPDANPCTTEACDPATGQCASIGNTSACDDGNACTTGEACGPTLSQDFDGVTAAELPEAWWSSTTGDGRPWETVGTSSDTMPNSAFGYDGPGPAPADQVLVSPPIAITTASAQLTFRNRWSFESATTCYDGGVLEIDIAGNGFTDIVIAGGSFLSGGYDGTVSTSFSNPLGGRSAWCHASPGYPDYLTTVVGLPAAAAGETIRLRWRIGTDVSVGALGQNIDSIVLTDGSNSCRPGTAPVPAPPETENMAAGADKATYSWSAAPSATQYDVLRGSLGAFPVGPGGADEVCFDELASPALVDPELPSPDTGYWYVSRGESSCGDGTYGNLGVKGAAGAPRTSTTCP